MTTGVLVVGALVIVLLVIVFYSYFADPTEVAGEMAEEVKHESPEERNRDWEPRVLGQDKSPAQKREDERDLYSQE